MSFFNVINILSLLPHYNTIINLSILLFSFNVNFLIYRQIDGSAQTTSFVEWLAWIVGQPGALAHQIISIRQNIETLLDRWKRDLPKTRPSTGTTGGK